MVLFQTNGITAVGFLSDGATPFHGVGVPYPFIARGVLDVNNNAICLITNPNNLPSISSASNAMAYGFLEALAWIEPHQTPILPFGCAQQQEVSIIFIQEIEMRPIITRYKRNVN